LEIIPGSLGQIIECDPNGTDAETSQCLNTIAMDLKSNWGPGIKDLGLPPMDPLTIGEAAINAGSTLVNFNAALSGVTLTGLNNLTATNYV